MVSLERPDMLEGAVATVSIRGLRPGASRAYQDCFSEGEVAPLPRCGELLLPLVWSARPDASPRIVPPGSRSPPAPRCSVYAVALESSPSSSPVSRKIDLRFLLRRLTMEKDGSLPDPSRSRSSVLCELNLGRTGGAKLGSWGSDRE